MQALSCWEVAILIGKMETGTIGIMITAVNTVATMTEAIITMVEGMTGIMIAVMIAVDTATVTTMTIRATIDPFAPGFRAGSLPL